MMIKETNTMHRVLICCSFLLSALLAVAQPGFPADETPAAVTMGAATTLAIRVAEAPVHDRSFGKTRIELSGIGKETIKKHEIEGMWRAAGFQTRTKEYVLLGEFGMGAWLPITSIAYLDERTGSLRYSTALSDGWYAFAAVSSKDMKYIAFAGGRRLWVLHTATDSMKSAGRTPQPPPVTEDFCLSSIRNSERLGEWTWGDICVDGYLEMDPGIITFASEDTLKVSYGKDSFEKRSKKRTTKTIDLQALFSGKK